jgi:hypothetical protein
MNEMIEIKFHSQDKNQRGWYTGYREDMNCEEKSIQLRVKLSRRKSPNRKISSILKRDQLADEIN